MPPEFGLRLSPLPLGFGQIKELMKRYFYLTTLLSFASVAAIGQDAVNAGGHSEKMAAPVFANYKDLKWDKILPDLGDASPEICVLHVDPATKATKLLIRSPKSIHIRK